MIILDDVLSPIEVAQICDGLANAPFRDGRATTGAAARRVKDNEQARGDDRQVIELSRIVRSVLEMNSGFSALVRPSRWSNLIFSRYGPGQQYGRHTDNAAMYDEHGRPLRTDISFTLFLADPADYDGGALRVEALEGVSEVRPSAGSVAIYPTGQVHGVTAVTRGARLACVGWVQSVVRRADQRELLFDLERARGSAPEGETQLLLDKAIGNLLRMWGES